MFMQWKITVLKVDGVVGGYRFLAPFVGHHQHSTHVDGPNTF